MIQVAPSLLAADWLNLGDSVRLAETAGADWLHVDVMDGHFVPNLSMGADITQAVIGLTSLPVEVHLMVERPEHHLDRFLAAGPQAVSVHAESSYHLHYLVDRIKASGVAVGVALNPATPWETLLPVLRELDYVLVMTVNPGFGGQKLIPRMLDKIAALDGYLKSTVQNIPIWVDGGVNLENKDRLLAAGARVLVAGTAFYGAANPAEFVKEIKGHGETS